MELTLYPKNILERAKYIFDNIFLSAPDSFKTLESINIIVIGAGEFPSFLPLLSKIVDICPNMTTANFTLVDPDHFATDKFKQRIPQLTRYTSKNINLNFSLINCDIKAYLKNPSNHFFDLIFFEHPDISIFNVLMAKLGLTKEYLEISLQESISYISNITKTGSVIIASFIFKGELNHAFSLFKYCLGIDMKLVRQKKIMSVGGYYSYGLIGVINNETNLNKSPEVIARKIRFHSTCFALFFILSILLLIILPYHVKTFSVFFMIAQLFYHGYGKIGLMMRILFIIGQLILLSPFFSL